MKIYQLYLLALSFGGLLLNNAFATNPLITDQFTADPTARVFEGKVYVYLVVSEFVTSKQGLNTLQG